MKESREFTFIGAAIGGVIGLFAGVSIALAAGIGLLWGALLSLGLALSLAGIGGGIGYAIANRLPPMLPAYRSEHDKLRQTAKRVRKTLKKIQMGEDGGRTLDLILNKDAELRHRASKLKEAIAALAHENLGWSDRIVGGIDVLSGAMNQRPGKRLTKIDWEIQSYRAKLEREADRLDKETRKTTDLRAKTELESALAMKQKEKTAFEQIDGAVQFIEAQLARNRASLEAVHGRATRLIHLDAPLPTAQQDLAQELDEQLHAYERALEEARFERLYDIDSQEHLRLND